MRSPTRPRGSGSPALSLAVACAGVFNAALDQTTVVTALPPIMTDLRLTVSELDRVSWTITAYLLGYTAAMPVLGRLSDVYGRRRAYLLALAVFSIGTGLAAAAQNLPWLVASRTVMAIGGGAMVPVTIALTGDLLPAGRRVAALGIAGGTAEAGAVLGPLWGGTVVRLLDWRWIFWLNIPVSLVIALLLLAFLRPGPRLPRAVDYRGGLLLAGGVCVLTLGLARWGEQPAQAALGVGLGLLLMIAYAALRGRSGEAVVPVRLLRRGALAGATGAHLLVGGALIIAMVSVPLMTDTVMGQPPFEGGLRLLRLTAAIPAGALLGGVLATRVRYRVPAAAGLAVAGVAFWLMSAWTADVGEPLLTAHLALAGAGFGLVVAPIAGAAVNAVGPSDRGAAAALVTLARMAGMTWGLAAITSYGTSRFRLLVGGIDLSFLDPGYAAAVSGAGMTVFREFFVAAGVLCLVAIGPALLLGTGHRDEGEVGRGRPRGPAHAR